MAIPRRETEQGFEMQFGVNHLGHRAHRSLLVDSAKPRSRRRTPPPAGAAGRTDQRATFVTSIFLASVLVAVLFIIWREQFYEQRATYLYESMSGDDHVLVPMRGDSAGQTARLDARSRRPEVGKVVLTPWS